MIKVALSAAALVLAMPVAAQDAVPDLSGFWGPDFVTDTSIRMPDLLAKLPADAVLIEDAGAAEFPRGEFGGLVLTPDAAAHAETWNAEQDMAIDRVCLPPSIVYGVQGPFPFEVHQTPTLIVFKYEYFDQVRLIHMDGRAVPENVPLSKVGYSVGHWEGEDLVIETSRIAASTITNNGLDHTDGIVMVERYRKSEDGTRLHATQWFRDRAVLETDGARYLTWTARPGQYVYPYECDPSFALEYAQVDGE
ncbi:hypothetical protein [Alteraurantiacibacter palmitatis]|uniref:Uncharacterized protein n=1 Tax=Alteraurantiacibacter palmitatis TaxID=2054628 RepID=A0ABV7E4Y6_9SPHN